MPSVDATIEGTGSTRTSMSTPSSTPSRMELTSSSDRKSTRLNSSHSQISYAVFCLKKKKNRKADVDEHLKAPLVLALHHLADLLEIVLEIHLLVGDLQVRDADDRADRVDGRTAEIN